MTLTALIFLIGLLIVPALALQRLTGEVDLRWVTGYAVLVSLITFLFYSQDKKRAQAGGSRTPESILHFLEMIGGWPGAFLAQRALRHKIAQTRYQMSSWMIIALHQFVAFDSMQDWQYCRQALSLLPR